MSDPGKDAVKKRLEALGFVVNIIPEDPKQSRPDLSVAREGVTMFVEVKTRTEDAELRTRMESVGIGATESFLVSLDKHNSLSSDVGKANAQLRAMASVQDLRLLWFRADNGLFIQDATQQIGATLLGIRMVMGKCGGEKQTKACIYAGYADFFRYKEIDGAMIESDDGGIMLIPNEFSPRHDLFLRSPISRAVAPAVFDVREGDREGAFYVVDGDVNRKDEQALLLFLREKYPKDEFLAFGPHSGGTTVTTIDARANGCV